MLKIGHSLPSVIPQRAALWVCTVLLVAACGGGGGSATATVYSSSSTCSNGARLTSTTSQVAADALVPANCPSISAAQQTAIAFAVSTSGIGAATSIVLELSSLPAGALLAASSLTVSDGAGQSYALAISPSPLSITATPALPFASNFTVSAGSLNFTNAPSASLVGKTFTTGAAPQAPVARIVPSSAPYYVGTAVSFNGGTSTDADGTIVTYGWSFGGGAVATGQTTSHAYAAAGSYTISLTVTDNSGMQHTSTAPLTVVPVPLNPVAVVTPSAAPYYIAAPIGFSGAASYDPDGSVASYAWAFGDGATAPASANASASHAYAAAGTYAVSLTVTDNSGRTHTASSSVTVVPVPVPPVAILTLSAAPYVKGDFVGYSAIASTDADGTIASYAWVFGDGTTASTATTTHAYAAAGTYTVSLTVTDNSGLSHTTSRSITVATGALNDTGTTAAQCYEAGSDAWVACTSAGAIALNPQQDGMIGRDVTANANADGRAGFSFALIANPAGGNFATTDCVKDQTTGLIWEGKTATGTRAGSNAYTHYDSTTALQFYVGYDSATGNDILRAPTPAEVAASTNAAGYLAAVNAAALCGYSDWRLPTRSELQSVVDYGVAYPEPTIDAAWFSNTAGDWYWSSSPYAGNSDVAWYVSFYGGYVYDHLRDYSFHVRLVR